MDRIANVSVVSIEIVRSDGTREAFLGTVAPIEVIDDNNSINKQDSRYTDTVINDSV